MAALNDMVVQYLAPPPAFDQHEVGIAPVLVGQVIAAGTGAPGSDWDVQWSNGAISIDHDDTILTVLATPFNYLYCGRKARIVDTVRNVSPEAIGIIRMHDANNLYVLEMPNGTFYTLSQANLQLLDS